jgi:hypothetical protein
MTKSHDQKAPEPQPNAQRNEGEGNRTAARRYNDAQHAYVESGRSDAAAEEAKRAVDGKEGDELRAAEKEGKRHAQGTDVPRPVPEDSVKTSRR